MSFMKKNIFIHCGLHKTATKSLQNILAKNENLIEIHIPKIYRKSQNKKSINHAPLAWEIIKDKRANSLYGNIELFNEDIQNKKNVFLTSEDFALILSNNKTKKKFEELFINFKIYYLCFYRNDKNHLISLLTTLMDKYKNFKKIYVLIDFISFIISGYTSYKINSLKEDVFFITNHKKLVRNFKKNSKGKFLFFEHKEEDDILPLFKDLYFFKRIIIEQTNLNSLKSRKFYWILSMIYKSKKIFIKKNRNYNNIKNYK